MSFGCVTAEELGQRAEGRNVDLVEREIVDVIRFSVCSEEDNSPAITRRAETASDAKGLAQWSFA